MAIYPVFAQYKPPIRCTTAFDNENYSFLSFDEIKKLSTGKNPNQKYSPRITPFKILIFKSHLVFSFFRFRFKIKKQATVVTMSPESLTVITAIFRMKSFKNVLIQIRMRVYWNVLKLNRFRINLNGKIAKVFSRV